MGLEHHYEPCFASIPDSIPDRWTLLRKFVSQWHNLNVPLTRDLERAAHDIEQTLKRELPYPIREWIAFSRDLIGLHSFESVMRDIFEVTRMNRFACTTLMIQGEGDIYWSVADRYVNLDDPPVDCLRLDMDSDEWVEGWNEALSLTSFTLCHMAYFLGIGFVRTRDIDESVVAAMTEEFPIAMNFDGLRVFEMRNLIAFIRHSSENESTLIVARKAQLPAAEMPACIRRLSSR